MAKTLSPELLETLRQIDTPTLANAIEAFKVRDRTEGYVGGDIRCLFPELGPMVGYAVTVASRPARSSATSSAPNTRVS